MDATQVFNQHVLSRQYQDPDTNEYFSDQPIRQSTLQALAFYNFLDDAGRPIKWSHGQLEILDCLINRSDPTGLIKRIQIKASTQYGKSLAVAAGIVIRASLHPERWAIVAGTTEKARIIMEYVIMLALNNEIIRTQLTADTPLDRLRMKKSADRLTFKRKGEVRVYSAEAGRVTETSKALMGFGSQNVVEDESALVPDILQATVIRMLGGNKDNFLVKIGNPFNRNHFLKTWTSGKYYRIFIDYNRAIVEGRYSQEFINEMMGEAMFDILYECKTPGEGMIDAKGWQQLLTEDEVRRAFVQAEQPFGDFRLGADVAGGGRNFSTMVLRAYNVATKIYKKNIKDTMLFAGNVIQFANQLGVAPDKIFIDKVGIGRGASDRLREQEKGVGVAGSEEPSDTSRYANKRAEMYWRAREWILRGGKLEQDDDWFELTKMKWKVADSSGKIKMMSKEEMLKEGIDSPDVADALSMTFYSIDVPHYEKQSVSTEVDIGSLNPY